MSWDLTPRPGTTRKLVGRLWERENYLLPGMSLLISYPHKVASPELVYTHQKHTQQVEFTDLCSCTHAYMYIITIKIKVKESIN